MDEFSEKRVTKRIPQSGGLGLELWRDLKRGTVVILRPVARTSRRCVLSDLETTPFNLVTAKVRWCREVPSPAGISLFRVGVQRMLPSC